MKNIHNRNVPELAHCIIVFKTKELGICFSDKGVLIVNNISRSKFFKVQGMDFGKQVRIYS